MPSPRELLCIIESTLLSPSLPSPSQRIELLRAIRSSFSSLQNILSYPPPRASDRSQVQTREVRLPDSSLLSLDDQDVQLALKLSDDLHLNEIDCVQLLIVTNEEWGLMGRDPLEILRLAAGIWYTERGDLLTAIYTLLKAVVLDQGLEADFVADIHKYLEDLFNSGLRQRFVTLIKELNREDTSGLGGPHCERYILDSECALVERRSVVTRERLVLAHCFVLSILVVRPGSKDVKDAFHALKDIAAEISSNSETLKHQITFSLFFALVIAFISDALGTVNDRRSILSNDSSFRHEFHGIVMTVDSNSVIEGFINGVRLAWVVHLLLIQDVDSRESASRTSSDLRDEYSCLDIVFSNNTFQFLLEKILQTAAFQNEDEDMLCIYYGYLHKLMTCFFSHSIVRSQLKEIKEKAMFSPFHMAGSRDLIHGVNVDSQFGMEVKFQPFVSLLEFVSEIWEKEPEFVAGDDDVWNFAYISAEDHTNFESLVAFLRLLSALASSQDGASKVFDLLQSKKFRSIGWSSLFDCLSIYEEKFKQSLQSNGALLPEFQEGDAKVLTAYLNVLQKILKTGSPSEKKNWFPDIEPLFKLLGFENVPPYLKGALRNSIATLVEVSPELKDNVWRYLEQYDLPVVGPLISGGTQPLGAQTYDMYFELNEIEARQERYPSTISFINLLNILISLENDVSDRGLRFIGIFKFISYHVFEPFHQRAFVDPCEKWRLAVSCLEHFLTILRKYDIKNEDDEYVMEQSQLSNVGQPTALLSQLPVLELMKDFMSGKSISRNIIAIILPGVNVLISERSSQIYGQHLEKAILLSLEIICLVFEKDGILSDFWRPLYLPLDIIFSQDQHQIIALLEYVRYNFQSRIQQCSVKIMTILSCRTAELVQMFLRFGAADSLIEDYASCFELRLEESQIFENTSEDIGVLILQLLIDNISRPAPNITHFLLKFDVDVGVERTVLQPKFRYSCLKVILDTLERFSKPDVNGLLYELCFKLLYYLCVDPLTCGPTMDLLCSRKYIFFVKYLDSMAVSPLPKRSTDQVFRISSLHQRAWLLKLLAVELHAGDMSSSSHREACQSIVAHVFGLHVSDFEDERKAGHCSFPSDTDNTGTTVLGKRKMAELLEVVQFKTPDTVSSYSNLTSNPRCSALLDDVLSNPATSDKGGIFFYSERGDRLIDLSSLRDKIWQKFSNVYQPSGSLANEADLRDQSQTIKQILLWAWQHNRNLEEQASQLHMLTGWSHIVEVLVSRPISFLEVPSEILFQLIDSCLAACGSQDCSLKMALILSQISLTCLAKLQDEKFLFPLGLDLDNMAVIDMIMTKPVHNGFCNSILLKLVVAIMREETSERLRIRLYALLLTYIQYCQPILDLDIPSSILQLCLGGEKECEDEISGTNFSILKKEANWVVKLMIKDAMQGSEAGRTISLYVLEALVCIDREGFFLDQLQKHDLLRTCFMNISSASFLGTASSQEFLQKSCILEAELSLLLRVSHKYGRSGAQILNSLGAIGHIASSGAMNLQGSFRRLDNKFQKYVESDNAKRRRIVVSMLRLVFSLTCLLDTSDLLEVKKNNIVREVVDFVRSHHIYFEHALQEDFPMSDELSLDEINLVTGILTKVWPYENDEYGLVQGLFVLMHTLFSRNTEELAHPVRLLQNQWDLELWIYQICFHLSSYLYFLVSKKSLRLLVSVAVTGSHAASQLPLPTISLIGHFLNTLTVTLERAAEERFLLLNKVRDINELSGQEVDDVITMCMGRDGLASTENIQKRRCTAMMEMCRAIGNREQLVAILLPLSEQMLNILLIHFEDGNIVKLTADVTKTKTSEMFERMISTVKQLALLNEEKLGEDLKLFKRLATSLKESIIQKLAL